MDELMRLTGLRAVKASVLSLYNTVRVVAERHALNGTAGGVLKDTCLHMRFDGCALREHYVCKTPMLTLRISAATRARAKRPWRAWLRQRCSR
jgi:hypothetical protein